MTKRELQRPDKFLAEGNSVLDWAHEHPREVAMAGAGLLVLILVIGLVFGGKSERVDPKAGADLAAALELVDRPVAPPTEGQQPADAAAKPFATEKEKQEAIVAALSDVRQKHPGTTTATSAALPLADAKYKLGNYDEAISLYDEYLKQAPQGGQLRFLALEGKAQSLEAKGDLNGALAAWDKLGTEVEGQKDRALYGKARVLEQQQKWDDARAAYEQLQKDFQQSPLARMASERLASLNRLHPAPAAAAAPAPKAEVASPTAGE